MLRLSLCWLLDRGHCPPLAPGTPATAEPGAEPLSRAADNQLLARMSTRMGLLHRSRSGLFKCISIPTAMYGSSPLLDLRRTSGDEPARPSHGKGLQEPGTHSASTAFPSSRAGGLHSINVSLRGSRLDCLTISCQLIENLGLHAFHGMFTYPGG